MIVSTGSKFLTDECFSRPINNDSALLFYFRESRTES